MSPSNKKTTTKKENTKKQVAKLLTDNGDNGLWAIIKDRYIIVIVSVAVLLAVSVVTLVILRDKDRAADASAQGGCEIRLLLEDKEGKQWLKVTPPKDSSLSQVEFDGTPRIIGMEVEGCGG